MTKKIKVMHYDKKKNMRKMSKFILYQLIHAQLLIRVMFV